MQMAVLASHDDDEKVEMLANAKSLKEWMDTMIREGSLLVPGSWWKGVGEEERRTTYPCEIVKVIHKRSRYGGRSRYEFEIGGWGWVRVMVCEGDGEMR